MRLFVAGSSLDDQNVKKELYTMIFCRAVHRWVSSLCSIGNQNNTNLSLLRGRSGLSTQWTQYAVDAVRSGIVVYGGFLHQRQCSHHHVPLFHWIHSVHWFDLFAPKTTFPPPYTTIPLHPLV